MASSKQAKRIFTQGKKIVSSKSNKLSRSISENDDSQEESSQLTNICQSGKQEKQQKITRPNAFLSFRITNQEIIDHANEIQKQIIESNPLLSKASISIPTLHITLMVFALKTEEDKERARQSLLDVCHQISLANLPSPQITFTGLSHFNNKVLYMGPVKDAHFDVLARIAEICREAYEKNGILSTDVRAFNPHLTLFKLSKARDLHRKGVKKIDPCWSSKYIDHHFGIENLQSLHLCNMMKKQQDGYYEIFHEQHLFHSNPVNNDPDLSINLNDQIEISVSVVNNIERRSDDRTVVLEPTICIPSVTDESSPLLQHDQPMHKEAFSGFASFFRCSCCSIT